MKENTRALINNENSILGVKNIMIDVLEKIQYHIMGEEKNIKLRQEIGILFVNTKNNIDVLNIIGDVVIWSSENEKNEEGKNKEKLIFVGMLLGLVGFLTYAFRMFYLEKNYKLLIFTGIAIGLNLSVLVLGGKLYKRKNIVEKKQKTEISISTDKAIKYLENLIDSLERYINEFQILNSEENQENGRIPKEVLELFQTLYEGINTKNEIIISSLNNNISNILIENNIEKLEYKKENEKYFDVLPSKNIEMTIKPSFIQKGSEKILLRGVATKKID